MYTRREERGGGGGGFDANRTRRSLIFGAVVVEIVRESFRREGAPEVDLLDSSSAAAREKVVYCFEKSKIASSMKTKEPSGSHWSCYRVERADILSKLLSQSFP